MRWTPLLLLICALFARADQSVLKIATGGDFAPYSQKEAPNGGLFTHAVTRAFEESGTYRTELLWVPWKRALSMARHGEIDGTFPWGDLPERRANLLYSEPFFSTTRYIWVSRYHDFRPESHEDLDGRHYCNPLGYGDFGLVKEMSDAGKLQRVTPQNLGSCMSMLVAGRVDFVPAHSADALDALKKAGIDPETVYRTDIVSQVLGMHFVVSRSHPRGQEIINAINHGLNTLRRSGELDSMSREFGLPH